MTTPTIIIEPTKGWVPFRLKNLWEYRELLYFLIWKDLKVRYKQTLLGVLWVILQPLLTMIVFTIFFGKLAGVQNYTDQPYPVFTFTALLPWQLFAGSLSLAGNSLIQNQHLITKVYFPRLIVPLSAVFTNVVDFFVSLLVLFGLLVYYGITPSAFILTLPIFIIMAVLISFAVSLWLAALNVQFRDVRYTIPFLTQLWLFITPVVYPMNVIPDQWKLVYGLNPMVGIIEGFRWALMKGTEAPDINIYISFIITGLLLIGGLFYFRRMERTFADVI